MKTTLRFFSLLTLLCGSTWNSGLTSAAQAAPAGSFKPCDRISAADVQPFFKTPVQKTSPKSNYDGTSWQCFFAVTDVNGWMLTISVNTNADFASAMFSGNPPTDDSKPGVALSGIGDLAIRESNDVWVYARKGNMSCMVHGDHSYAYGGNMELMRGLILSDSRAGKIPAATAQVVSEALGTLCNRAFGSGNTTPSFANLP